MMTTVPAVSSWMRLVASMPSTPGICRSMSTTSGCSFEALIDRGLTVGDDLDHAQVLFLVEGHLERLAERAMIVGDDDGDRFMGLPGRHRGAS